MATLLLSAAGAAIGGTVQGTVLGLTGATLGQAAGATLGRVIDQRLMGRGSEVVHRGRTDRFRLTGAGEGAVIPRLWGRMRLAGHVIWASPFTEHVESTGGGGGKGRPATPRVDSYSYTVSLAIALCEGEIAHVGRIWADGEPVAAEDIALTLYRGGEDQLPDPLIAAYEGAAPAYRGTAYVVIEDLDLAPYGNRVPQFTFEVVRHADPVQSDAPILARSLRAVALMPGSGEHALAASPVTVNKEFGRYEAANVASGTGRTDLETSLAALRGELPQVDSVSLIVSWFGDDLRVGHCTLRPKVETAEDNGDWHVAGLDRDAAQVLGTVDGRVVYGGTPTDASVIEAIRAIQAGGQSVLYYPFILMEILAGNGLPDPYGGAEQAPLPWRGRITGLPEDAGDGGTAEAPDGPSAAAQVAAFFGTAQAADFRIEAGRVIYDGPEEWSYRRFILHQAALCVAAGGVGAFCIGSEMRGLTTLRGADGFPAVDAFRALLAEVRALMGSDVKLGYAADWTEYGAFQDGDEVFFPLDPLWADPECDFVGIDNYMPLSDWRDGDDHLDAQAWPDIHDIAYLQANIEGGEGYDWFYPTPEARDAQRRVGIEDGARGEPFTFRYKDLRGWWSGFHTERLAPLRASLMADGAHLATWSAQGDLTVGAAPLPGWPDAVDLVGGAGGPRWQNRVVSAPFPTVAARPYRLSVWAAAGTAGTLRISLGHSGGGALYVDNDFAGARFDTLEDGGQILEARVAPEGAVLRFEIGLRFDAPDGATEVRIGPLSQDGGVIVAAAAFVDPQAQVTAWVPGSKPIWFTEIGCAAVDKGTNQPNKFLDPRSAESGLPFYSNGRRDDLIQINYLRAITDYWADPANNPQATAYDGRMIDTARIYAWAWDARPWPAFPNDLDRWSDGANHARGHWLTGRVSAQPLAAVVAEICEAAGLPAYDVSQLWDVVRGYLADEVSGARARLEPLMLAYGLEAVERGGRIVFRARGRGVDGAVTRAEMAVTDDLPAPQFTRAAEVDAPGRVRLTYTEADGEFETRVAEATYPGTPDQPQDGTDLTLALTRAEARGVAERFLAEARVAQDTAVFALPPSRRDIGAGDVVRTEGGLLYRVDRLEDAGVRTLEAVRTEAGLYVPSDTVEAPPVPVRATPPLPVEAVFLDLPLLTGQEVPHAPHIAAAARPWPGQVAVYAAPQDAGYTLDTTLEVPAVMGVLTTPLAAAAPGVWDRGPAVEVRLISGTLASADPAAVLAGANACAIGGGGPGGAGRFEVMQFADAALVAPDLWALSMRLRGQAGTDAFVPAEWPAGTLFVLLDGRPKQIGLTPAQRGIERHYRIGPAKKALDHASYTHVVAAFEGVGLRPYAPAHLRGRSEAGGLAVTWIRRARIDGDAWTGLDVPLGEAREAYLIRVRAGGGIRREAVVATPAWTYAAADIAADGVAAPYAIEVAQISDRFGPGPFARIEIDV